MIHRLPVYPLSCVCSLTLLLTHTRTHIHTYKHYSHVLTSVRGTILEALVRPTEIVGKSM